MDQPTGTLKTLEKAQNTADTKYSEVQGQTRQHPKLINLLEVEQICICVDKMDCDTADNKQEKSDEISNKVTSSPSENLERILDGTSGTNGANETNEMTENEYD